MWLSVMAVFLVYATIFILFEDYDRKFIMPFNEVSDWHLLLFSLIVMAGLGFLLFRYAHRMDERISREQAEKENRMRRDVKQQFIVRTNAQARRLTTLLQDISTLNRMDYARDMITMERVNISVLFADIAQETSFALQNRQMTLHNYLPEDIIIHGNYSLLYSIFRNLMDNAINYAGQGTTVEVSAEQRHDCWRFTFKDNGIGIPARHLPRIFERFYRIDKGRSREMGGTGLGLSIVKNAVMLHGGNITVSSPSTGGLEFAFTISSSNLAANQ